MRRLQFLEQLDLARKGRGTTWHVEEDFKQALRQLGARNDIIGQLYGQLGNEAGRVAQMTGGVQPSAPISGVVIAKGSVDEIGEDRFVVLRDGSGQAHYGRVRESDAYQDLHIGSVAELGSGAQRRRQVTEQIATIAKANDGVYSVQLHEAHLRAVEPEATDREILSKVRSGAWRLGFVAGFVGSGVRALEGGEYAVDVDAFARFSQRGAQRTDVRVIAEHALAQQIEAHAVTWLDRQAFGRQPDPRTAGNPIIQEVIQQRQEWLVRNGYAERTGGEAGTVELRLGALEQLAAEEWAHMSERLTEKYGKPVMELSQGGTISGEYRGTEHLHSGKLAVVISDQSVYVSPVSKTPDVGIGGEVTLERMSAQDASVELVAGRTLDLDAGLSADGPGGES